MVILFPWTALMQGLVILMVMDDFNNIVGSPVCPRLSFK